MSLKDQLSEQQKIAMRARNKARLGTLRMLLAEIKQKEIDSRELLDDDAIITIVTKMVKQRKDSATQFEQAGRQELADGERQEIVVLQEFLPQPLTADELDALLTQAIADTGATGMQDMGKVMAVLKPQIQGRADMGKVSASIKARLA
ncbi:GatB/YqeY domain-containing protein [Oceanisphaera arctica]|uniref:Glutamyl-tRNA amidotransferase n=1 Tax=Oceanisphaera arctica TaxID=641510 RepID=A0A2P5TN50_9GAMM|nr:GatB/YqeY domain-containing protein [Oceanisphaera arctica]PPL16974.1 glutamyl-tRNA amidotransferase [Oceanisphaera arctica]GHA07765.1 aspartyl-tRNA amidotransferase subunit B [Oceanisphaera arctica]